MNKIKAKYNQLAVEVRASFWFLICSFLQRGISVITTPVFTRLMSTQEYGQYSVFQSWLEIGTVLVSLKLYAGVFLQGIVKQENKEKFTSAMQGLSFTLVVIWAVIYYAFHNFFNRITSLTTVQTIAMLLLIWTTGVFSYWSVEQRMENKYKPLIIITLLTSFLKPAIGIILVVKCTDKVVARIVGLVFIELIFYIWLFVKKMKEGKCFYNKVIWKYALSFNIPLIPHYLSMAVLNSTDRIMIKYYQGEAKVGIYSLAYSVALIMTVFNSALLQTVEPWLYKKINAKKEQDISQVAYITLTFIAIVNIGLIAIAPEAVKLFAPSEYAEAIWVIPSVAMSVYFMFAYSFFASFEFYFEKTQGITFATLAGAVTNIILNMIFIPLFGYYAAGYTTLICYILFTAMHYFFMSRICEDNLKGKKIFNIKILLSITIIFLLSGFVFLLTYNYIVIRYILIVVLLFGAAKDRKEIVKNIVRIISIKKEEGEDNE